MTFIITGRDEWSATGTQSRYGKMRLPAKAVWLHHSVTAVSTNPRKDMRKVEQVGQERFGQFPYSYCVHPDGTILEGAGRLIGAHTARRNSTSFGVALIGNYNLRDVTVWQIDAVRWLIARLVDDGDLTPGVYPTGGHRDVSDTACPGDKAYRLIDAFRLPWDTTKGIQVADNPEIPNLEGPLTFHPIANSEGEVTGYYVFGTMTGELHAHPNPDHPGKVRYLGRSEDPTPDDEQ